MNAKQQRKVEILTRLDAGTLDVGTAAEMLGVGARQVRRLRARFRQEGMCAVIHGNSGCQPIVLIQSLQNGSSPWLAPRVSITT